MALLSLVLGCDPLPLLERAAEGFLTPATATTRHPFPSPDYLLALRQGALRDDLILLAAGRKIPGWFDPPLCAFQELPRWLGVTSRRPCGDFERAALLAQVIRRVGGRVFGGVNRLENFLDGVERLFGELVAEGVAPEEFESAAGQVAGAAEGDDFDRLRDAELAQVYRTYCAELEGAGLRDGRDALVDAARAVAENPDGVRDRLGHRREIRLFGLHDLRGGWRPLLRALAACPVIERVIVYGSHRLDFGPALDVAIETLAEPAGAAVRLFTGPVGGSEHFDVIEAPSVERELGEVARRVRELADRGVSLSRIAVISRQSRPYGDLVLRALATFGVPGTARRRYAYQEIPVVRAVLSLFAAAAEGWTRAVLVELADQPYFVNQLDSRVLDMIGYRRVTRGLTAWADALETLERKARELEHDHEAAGDRHSALSVARIAKARVGFREFADHAADLDHDRPLGEWLAWLRAFLAADPWRIENRIYAVPEDRFDIAKRDLAGWRGLSTILEEWEKALTTWGGADGEMGPVAFSGRLNEMLAGDVALWTESRRGVRVLESLAAAYRSFDHVFLVGMEAGRFPEHAPRSAILDDIDRSALREAGLPLDRASEWDEREQNLFRTHVAGARVGLTLSFSRLNVLGQESIRSAFVEALADVAIEVPAIIDQTDVLTPGTPLYPTEQVARHAHRVATIERKRSAAADLSPHAGQIMDPRLVSWCAETFGEEYVWSPTGLEDYAKCPWAFFSRELLHLEAREDPDDEMEASVRGRIYHLALARFYDAAKRRIGGSVALRIADLSWAEPLLLTALEDAVRELAQRVWLGHPVLWDAKRQELERVLTRYIRWEAQLHEDMRNTRKRAAPTMLRTAALDHEHRVGEVVLERHGVRCRFRGVVDRVEIGIDDRIKDPEHFTAAIDYKTSVAATPGGGDAAAWDDHVVLQLPLYAYALSQERDRQVCRAEYRTLKSPNRVHALDLQLVDRKTHIRHPDSFAAAKLDGALDAVARHVLRVRSGQFPVEPAPSCKCPPFCHAWDICRVPGGPQTKPRYR